MTAPARPNPAKPLLAVQNLRVTIDGERGGTTLVDDVSLTVAADEVLCVVGESGSGKSVTMLSVLRLLDENAVRYGGSVRLAGTDLLALPPAAMRSVRGSQIAMIFQDPMTALNPVYPVGRQIVEQIRAHEPVSRRAARERAAGLLRAVGVPDPERRLDDFPHQLSGGLRQRVMIALALSCRPRLLIADEPTTALDVTVQSQILALLADLRAETGMAVILVTHDLGVVAELADRVQVMYAGRVVEEGPAADVFERAGHPYTWGLLGSIPRLDGPRPHRLPAIPGVPAGASDIGRECVFAARCPHRFEPCAEQPALLPVAGGTGHQVACHLTDAARRAGLPATGKGESDD